MISSMTGFGRGSVQVGGRMCTLEIKSLNHRFLDITTSFPSKKMRFLESRIKQRMLERFSRGKLDIYIYFNGVENVDKQIKIDHGLASQYFTALQKLINEYHLTGAVTIDHLAQFKDIFITEEVELGEEELWDILEKGLLEAIENLEEMRAREGAVLAKDITDRLGEVSAAIKEIKERILTASEDYRNRIKEKLAALAGQSGLDPYRLEQEVLYWVERADASEEVTRLESHLSEFLRLLDEREPIGRKLEFLLQEMNREINTAGSKLADLLISQKVITVKSELEKIRQQIQNIE